MKLSAHFTLWEMTKSQAALRHGIDNTPPPDAVLALSALCNTVLEPLRAAIGAPIVINSGYRCRELNTLIRGSSTSQHMKGEAADIESIGVSNLEIVNTLLLARIPFDQVILEFHDPEKGPRSGWVHISYKSAKQRREVLRTVRTDGGVAYLKGLGGKKR